MLNLLMVGLVVASGHRNSVDLRFQIKVLAFKDKGEWILEQKYNIGKKVKPAEDT